MVLLAFASLPLLGGKVVTLFSIKDDCDIDFVTGLPFYLTIAAKKNRPDLI